MSLSILKLCRPRFLVPLIGISALTSAGNEIVLAHASNQTFVPLLPTDLYIFAGVAAVALTVILLAFRQIGDLLTVLPVITVMPVANFGVSLVSSLVSFALLALLVYAGATGSQDPLVNPLPLYIWTVLWIGLVTLHAVFGNLWHWFNPWTGVYSVLQRLTNWEPPLKLPEAINYWPAIFGLFAFAIFMLASLAPEDPSNLAIIVAYYWLFHFIAMMIFGREDWLRYGECFSILMRCFAQIAPFGVSQGYLKLGVPGWKLNEFNVRAVMAGVFVIIVFASSSFDGLNETFWWLEILGINPLEFPGRSAIFWQTTAGLLFFNILIFIIFSLCVYAGLHIVGRSDLFKNAFFRLAICVIPIAVAYHFAHFLPTFLVNIQYALAATSDPWANGSDFLSLGTFYVSTGFFNTLESVRWIFLTQTTAIVLGHLFSILSAHNVALETLKNHRDAVISQLPLATFMIAYTFFGLWLLAAPRGA